MQNNRTNGFITVIFLFLFSQTYSVSGQFIEVGAGSYTTQYPGVDAAGRNAFPSGSPLLVGDAATKPAPTNDWWSKKIKENHADNLFNYPFTMKTLNSGLVVSYIPWGVIDAYNPVRVGVTGLNAGSANVSDFSDWTVTMDWSNSGHSFQATSGIGMPFIYFTKGTEDIAQITISEGNVSVINEMIIIDNAHLGADFVIYGPSGCTWTQNGDTYTSELNGKNYWSLAFLPFDIANIEAVANEYKKYAYVFPKNTITSWEYDQVNAIITTEFLVETEVKEGSETNVLLGLLPHQWDNLSEDSPLPEAYSYPSIRGELKTLDGNSFKVRNSFHGILPTLPYVDYYNDSFNPQELKAKIELIENDGLPAWTDSYNEGQLMNRLIQTARIADLTGDTIARDKITNTIKERLEDWLTAESGEVAFLFYYCEPWSTLIGYPAGHGQDGNINDHHFHWGYFIHAAAYMEQYEPGWADEWGPMINHLIRDAANPRRDDSFFPFLRNFSPYAGHCWANGFASFPQGNDQESTSESMQFNSSLIHWGEITGNDSIRDLGIYLYTTEQSAIEEYWFDMNDRIFESGHPYSLVSRVWGNSYDNGTFWTADIAASYGIEMYPIHGGSLYLGHDHEYVAQIWEELTEHTGILNNEANPNLWHDVLWEYLAFIDPDSAISLYNSYPDRALKFGVSDAQTYHWLYSMSVLGSVDAELTADHPLAVAFDKGGEKVYVAHNYHNNPIIVHFSDGYSLNVPANCTATSLDIPLEGVLSSNYTQAYSEGSVRLTLDVDGGMAERIEFIDGNTIVGEVFEEPYVFDAGNLSIGTHDFYARIYDGDQYAICNIITVNVGEQVSYFGIPVSLPGTIEAGYYDVYEGGLGQGIAYSDMAAQNNGNFREREYVDASMHNSEGAVIGWTTSGEWLEYTVDVEDAGYYTLSIRYACGNQNGGGPFSIESDGKLLVSNINGNYTGDWDSWHTMTINDVPLKSGEQVFRYSFQNGELNLGKFSFSYDYALDYDQPIADAGENTLVQLPQTVSTLDASASNSPGGLSLSYQWKQIYGPSVLDFSDINSVQPEISGLKEGVYLIRLEVSNGEYSDYDYVYIISSTSDVVAPKVAIHSPIDGSEFISSQDIILNAIATDLVGVVEEVEFFVNNSSVGSVTTFPYEISWSSSEGTYSILARARDDDGNLSTSEAVNITISPAPECFGISGNGEFEYEFSDDKNNPTLTFIPGIEGMGEPTCILYYGTDAGSLPGYPVTPNEPFRLNASEGTLIYFYYTYSYPGQGEHNNAGDKDSYIVGSCEGESTRVGESEGFNVRYYPNPVENILRIEMEVEGAQIFIYDITGKQIDKISTDKSVVNYDMNHYTSGIYFFKVQSVKGVESFKVLK
jgi:endoglucanase Acf2